MTGKHSTHWRRYRGDQDRCLYSRVPQSPGEARYEKMMSVMFLRSATKANCVRVPLDSDV